MGERPDKSAYFAKIPNDTEGQFFVYLLNKFLNSEKYSVRLRGNKANPKLLKKDGRSKRSCWDGVPKRYAQEFRLYLLTDDGTSRDGIPSKSVVSWRNYQQIDEWIQRYAKLSNKVDGVKQSLITMAQTL